MKFLYQIYIFFIFRTSDRLRSSVSPDSIRSPPKVRSPSPEEENLAAPNRVLQADQNNATKSEGKLPHRIKI